MTYTRLIHIYSPILPFYPYRNCYIYHIYMFPPLPLHHYPTTASVIGRAADRIIGHVLARRHRQADHDQRPEK